MIGLVLLILRPGPLILPQALLTATPTFPAAA
jgi:hypothetical protein